MWEEPAAVIGERCRDADRHHMSILWFLFFYPLEYFFHILVYFSIILADIEEIYLCLSKRSYDFFCQKIAIRIELNKCIWACPPYHTDKSDDPFIYEWLSIHMERYSAFVVQGT